MIRKDGFIDVNKMLEEIGVDAIHIEDILGDSKVIEIEYIDESEIHFAFPYHDETYYFKWSIYPNGSPYNELVVGELAKDFGISCVDYDLAVLRLFSKEYKGVLSKNFVYDDVNYIRGDSLFYDVWKKAHISSSNNLEDIWDALEYHYHNYPNKGGIVNHLMNQIVNIYLFDIITCQCDRHSKNWQIMESKHGIEMAPLYDNERILVYNNMETANVSLRVYSIGRDYENLLESIKRFQKTSGSEFVDIIKEKLWIISEENLNKVFERIEKKTGWSIPQERKGFYFNNYHEHKKRLEEVLNMEQTRKR